MVTVAYRQSTPAASEPLAKRNGHVPVQRILNEPATLQKVANSWIKGFADQEIRQLTVW